MILIKSTPVAIFQSSHVVKCWQLMFPQPTDVFTFVCFIGFVPYGHFYNMCYTTLNVYDLILTCGGGGGGGAGGGLTRDQIVPKNSKQDTAGYFNRDLGSTISSKKKPDILMRSQDIFSRVLLQCNTDISD